MFTFLLVVLILVSIALIAVILLQRSEGGALGMGGGGSGAFMSARGTANLLTRTTSILGGLFFLLSVGLVVAGNVERGGASVTDRVEVQAVDVRELARPSADPAAQPTAPTPGAATPSLDALTAPLPQAGAPAAPETQPAAPPPAQ
jgi:preprotein translocase subunit SecG